MRRILLTGLAVTMLALTAAAAQAGGRPRTGWLVVRNAVNDGGPAGAPVATVVVRGFVLGRVGDEGSVEIYHLGAAGQGLPQVIGSDVSRGGVTWHGVSGSEWSGSGFRFRAVSGTYRIVVRGSGIYLFAGGHGSVTLAGSVVSPARDGRYSLDGGRFRSLPSHPSTLRFGGR
jgi:hypothetical protein